MEGEHVDKEMRVREIAYRLWEEEGHPEGAAQRHWLAAEAMLGASDPERKTIESEPLGDERPPEMLPASARKRRATATARSA